MEVKQKNRSYYKREAYTRLIALIAIILVFNFISSHLFFRLDLTKEKRYTLSPVTKQMLKELSDVIYIKVYLDGNLPYGFKRLQTSIKEMLDEFRVYADDNIQYQFIDPSAIADKKNREEVFQQLYRKGLNPTNLQEKDEDGRLSQQVIWPGALITFKEIEIPVDFLKTNVQYSPEQNLNSSIEELEFSLASNIKKLHREFGHRIAFIEGHGEISEIEVADITKSLEEFYYVERLRIDEQISALSERIEDSITGNIRLTNKYDLIIIAGPDSSFSEKDKFIIDQFIMYGGRAMFLIDPVSASIDSLAYQNEIIAFIKSLNLDDMLFRYGARINPTLLQDIQCAVIPINMAPAGQPASFSPVPWVFFPVILPPPNHPITKNVNMLRTQFVSSIDTVGEDPRIKKTVLLTTSHNTKILNAPVRIGLNLIREKLDPRHFMHKNIPIAVLLEGRFMSLFENRLTPYMYESKEIAFRGESISTKIAVIADADLIRNNVRILGFNKSPMPLGYDRYTGETFGNKDFLLNTVSYLLDDSGLMQLRSREVKLRLLDRAKLQSEKVFWQIINISVPIIIIILFGGIIMFNRKRKYSKKHIK